MNRLLWLMPLLLFIVACTPSAEDAVYDPCTDETIIEFPDPHLEAYFRGQLAISDIEPIEVRYICRFWYIDSVATNTFKITDLTGLEQMPWLVWLHLSGHRVNSLEPLRNLVNIERLTLGIENGDIEPLTNLIKMRELNISGYNNIKSVEALAGMLDLEELYVGGNELESIEALANLKKLEVLSVNHSRLTNIEVIKNFLELQAIMLEENCISDFSPVEYLKQNGKLTTVYGDTAEEQDYTRCE